MSAYSLRVNGIEHVVDEAAPGENLLYVLRERLGLPGAKSGCEQGECGSCSVFVDGVLVCACLELAAAASGCDIVTPEGLRSVHATELTDVQRAFVEEGAVQCGFCTPGLVMAVHALSAGNREPSEWETREALAGNLCRCTGYGRIFEAVRASSATRDAR